MSGDIYWYKSYIRAIQVRKDNTDEVLEFLSNADVSTKIITHQDNSIRVIFGNPPNLHTVEENDWFLGDINGHLYSCQQEVFPTIYTKGS